MNKLAAFALTLITCASLTGCSLGGTPEAEETPAVSAPPEDKWGITLDVEDVTPTGLVIQCTQSGGSPTGELETSKPFIIQQLKGDQWMRCPTIGEAGWSELVFSIPVDHTTSFPKTWDTLYGELPSGTYRIGISIADYRGPYDFDQDMYYAQFQIP